MNKYLLLIFFISPVFTQETLNRSEKITVKRKMGGVGVYSDLDFRTTDTVSYTHLTLPTICSV